MLNKKQVPSASTIKKALPKLAFESLPIPANSEMVSNFLNANPNSVLTVNVDKLNPNAETLSSIALASGVKLYTDKVKYTVSVNAYHVGMYLQQYGVHPTSKTPISGLKKGVLQLNFGASTTPTNKLAEIYTRVKPSVYAPCNGVPFTATACSGNGKYAHCTLLPLLNGCKLNNNNGYDARGKQASNPNGVLVTLHSNANAIQTATVPQIKFYKNFIKILKG